MIEQRPEDSGSGRVILNFPEVAAKALWGPNGIPPASVVEWFDRVHAVIPEGLDDVLSAAFVRETGVLETALCVPLLFGCLIYTSPSPRDKRQSRMPSSA